jgi:hypothetical protein
VTTSKASRLRRARVGSQACVFHKSTVSTGSGLETVQQSILVPPLMADQTPTEELTARIYCVECGRSWDDDAERWRIKALIEEHPVELVPYCPACHEREFAGL